VKKYERHHELPEPKPKKVERPHQEWEVDAQGRIPVAGLGSASIINIVDVFSHLKIDSLPCLQTTHANTQDYQLVLRRAFAYYGLPEQISFDHDSVFYDNQTASPFPTLLHLWLIGLNIEYRSSIYPQASTSRTCHDRTYPSNRYPTGGVWTGLQQQDRFAENAHRQNQLSKHGLPFASSSRPAPLAGLSTG